MSTAGCELAIVLGSKGNSGAEVAPILQVVCIVFKPTRTPQDSTVLVLLHDCRVFSGAAEFHVGEPVPKLDAVICCTGYEYSFPFLDIKVSPAWSSSMLVCCRMPPGVNQDGHDGIPHLCSLATAALR
jgi:hypothetical protein